MARHYTITAGHPQWPQLSGGGRSTLYPLPNLIREQGEVLAPDCRGGWAPRKPLWTPSTARKAQWQTSCLVEIFWERDDKSIPGGHLNTNSCLWCVGWSRMACPDMPPLALLSWHSFLPGERAPQHHVRLPGAAASQAQIVLMSLAFCKSLPFFNFWDKQKKKKKKDQQKQF